MTYVGIINWILKFADNTKKFRTAHSVTQWCK